MSIFPDPRPCHPQSSRSRITGTLEGNKLENAVREESHFNEKGPLIQVFMAMAREVLDYGLTASASGLSPQHLK